MLKTLWRWLWRSIALFVAVVLIYQLWIFAHIWWWVDHNPSTSAFMEQRLEVLQSKKPDAELRHQWVPYNRDRKSVV